MANPALVWWFQHEDKSHQRCAEQHGLASKKNAPVGQKKQATHRNFIST